MFPFWKKYSSLNDEQLMENAQQGHFGAIDELYRRYNNRLFYFFFRMLGGDGILAQDFLQETFLKVIEHGGTFHPEKKFSIWIFAIAHNLCKNEFRRRNIRKNVASYSDTSNGQLNNIRSKDKLDTFLDTEQFMHVLTLELRKLKPLHRSVFLLRYQENLSVKEIGQILDCPEGTVKSRLHYTTQKLAHRLKDYNPFHNQGRKNEKEKIR